jgi:hypothetical protein
MMYAICGVICAKARGPSANSESAARRPGPRRLPIPTTLAPNAVVTVPNRRVRLATTSIAPAKSKRSIGRKHASVRQTTPLDAPATFGLHATLAKTIRRMRIAQEVGQTFVPFVRAVHVIEAAVRRRDIVIRVRLSKAHPIEALAPACSCRRNSPPGTPFALQPETGGQEMRACGSIDAVRAALTAALGLASFACGGQGQPPPGRCANPIPLLVAGRHEGPALSDRLLVHGLIAQSLSRELRRETLVNVVLPCARGLLARPCLVPAALDGLIRARPS